MESRALEESSNLDFFIRLLVRVKTANMEVLTLLCMTFKDMNLIISDAGQ